MFPFVLVKNLPYSFDPSGLFELFCQFGPILEIRAGAGDSKGQAIVTFNNMKSANMAIEKLKGINYKGRYLVVSNYTPDQQVIDSVTSLNS